MSANNEQQDSNAVLDYSQVTRYDTQPFFKAGDYRTVTWLHRKNGKHLSSSLLLQQASGSNEEVVGRNEHMVIQGAGASGIAGSTFFQMQAQIIDMSDASSEQ